MSSQTKTFLIGSAVFLIIVVGLVLVLRARQRDNVVMQDSEISSDFSDLEEFDDIDSDQLLATGYPDEEADLKKAQELAEIDKVLSALEMPESAADDFADFGNLE